MNIVAKALGRGRFSASVDGRVICSTTTTPFLSGARALQREGVSDTTPITMTHDGSPMVCLTGTVGGAAASTVKEIDDHGPRFSRYREFPEALALAA